MHRIHSWLLLTTYKLMHATATDLEVKHLHGQRHLKLFLAPMSLQNKKKRYKCVLWRASLQPSYRSWLSRQKRLATAPGKAQKGRVWQFLLLRLNSSPSSGRMLPRRRRRVNCKCFVRPRCPFSKLGSENEFSLWGNLWTGTYLTRFRLKIQFQTTFLEKTHVLCCGIC